MEISKLKKIFINTDGASRGNPGPASYGFSIADDEGKIIYQEGQVLGIATNNVAEYTAVLAALSYCLKNHLNTNSLKVHVLADSLLVIEQLSGRYKIKNETLIKIYQQIKKLERLFGGVSYEHVRREKNFVADRLANLALDKKR